MGEYLTDQLMLPLALAGAGEYVATTVSEHTRTNAAVIEAFLPVQFEFAALDSHNEANGAKRLGVKVSIDPAASTQRN